MIGGHGDEGRVAVVTGAGGGIGRTYAEALAEAGFAVVVADINEDAAEAVAKEIRASGAEAIAERVDVSSRVETLAMADRIRSRLGRADVLVNNAAMYSGLRWDPQLEVDIDYWRLVFSVNLDGALLCTQALAPMMVERGWGRIVNQSSAAAYLGTGGHYAVSKLALIGLTQGFARELGPAGVTVNAIAPGVIRTDATMEARSEEQIAQVLSTAAIARAGEPLDLVGALLFLLSDEAGWMTGQTLQVDGGWIARL